MRLSYLAFSALILVAAPQSVVAQETPETPDVPVVVDPGPPDLDGGTSYGLFLAGRAAMSRGDGEAATAFLAGALAESDDDRLVRERTFSAAILAGDVRTASSVRLVEGESTASLIQAGRLTRIAQAIIDDQSRDLNREIQANPVQSPHQLAGRLINRWLAASAGDWNTALAPTTSDADALTRILGGYYRALLLERRRQFDAADAQYQALLLDGSAASMTRLPYGEFLERRGRRAEAIALYDAGLARGADSALSAARQRATSRGRAPALITIDEGAALAFGHAAAAAAISEAHEFVITYLGMSLALDADNGESWLMLGDALKEIGMSGTAREAWAQTPVGAPEYVEAQIRIASSLDEDGFGDEAVRIARTMADGRPGVASAYVLAALLSSNGHYDAAIEVLNGPALADLQDWVVLFQRGAALERRGDYAAAESAFQQALALSPDQPEILNHLGYMWVDQNMRVEEGLALIERAVAAEPDNGNYQDSLGWARYRHGQFDEAVVILERAVGMEPGSATINDHLGDAYWQVGRAREASFQWYRALTLDPNDAERAALEAKLAGQAPSGAGSSQP
ncbi:tetratricopeptide repeat protein [Brevundimonas aveniformis]|uniref:tetratricopeptide repeat protein n=1 Tax=Brevundimonas aveniformis TaxID=370977 RepID=UPI00041836DE|nr:tetratricopeptide repeat protein [Brevundimonas aveniformis]